MLCKAWGVAESNYFLLCVCVCVVCRLEIALCHSYLTDALYRGKAYTLLRKGTEGGRNQWTDLFYHWGLQHVYHFVNNWHCRPLFFCYLPLVMVELWPLCPQAYTYVYMHTTKGSATCFTCVFSFFPFPSRRLLSHVSPYPQPSSAYFSLSKAAFHEKPNK